MNDVENAENTGEGDAGARVEGALYKKDFWRTENLNYARPHLRMEKVARLANKIAGGAERSLLDVGCGPAALRHLLRPNIGYHGIDIAIQEPAPGLIEADLIESPISFRGQHFDIVVAQGFFEYAGKHQAEKFAEIASLLNEGGTFIASYVNFAHRKPEVYWPYSNVQPFADFRAGIAEHFQVRKCYPTSYNWNHWEPGQKLVRAANMMINVNVPVIAPVLGVQYLLVCSPRTA
jgi:cyclopropane fatty-acyl-phospholipid synthase-like methyltransferase